MKEIVERLIYSILKAPKIKNSFLNNTKTWKRAHYIYLSEIIENELKQTPLIDAQKKIEIGTTLSPTTLKRIFEMDKSQNYTDDIRFIKTLDKLSLFLGFENLDHFIRENLNRTNELDTLKDIAAVPSFSYEENKKEEEEGFILIRKFCEAELYSIKAIPSMKLDKLDKIVISDSPIFKRVVRNLKELVKQGYVFNEDNNYSNYELFNFKIISKDEELIIVSTQEYWNLTLTNRKGSNTQIVNFTNEQVYFIKKINDVWGIWDNFNPYSDKIIENIKEKAKV